MPTERTQITSVQLLHSTQVTQILDFDERRQFDRAYLSSAAVKVI